MRKLILIFVILLLGFTLASCKEEDPMNDPENLVENTSLVSDLIDNIKGVFGD